MVQSIEVAGFGSVTVHRRKGMRSIRISINQTGNLRLSLPYGVSLQKGIDFLHTKKSWIQKHISEPHSLDDGAQLGQGITLRLHITNSSRVSSKYSHPLLTVHIPEHLLYEDVQKKIQNAAKKILVLQAQSVLLASLNQKAESARYSIKSSEIKVLKSRWGSCSATNDIVLNAFLIQLPQDCIDYVMWHELAHTKHHNHSSLFWAEVAKHVPNYLMIRKKLKRYPTAVFDTREFNL